MISPAPSGYVKIAIENGPVEIVDLPGIKWWLSTVFCMFTRGYIQLIIENKSMTMGLGV